MSANHYLPAARYVAQAMPGILIECGLKPVISRFILTETEQGNAWLFVDLETSLLQSQEDYVASNVLDYLSNALHGLPVVISNSYGLRYAVLLSSSSSQDPTDSEKQMEGWRATLPNAPV
jgi:hypothetical protein